MGKTRHAYRLRAGIAGAALLASVLFFGNASSLAWRAPEIAAPGPARPVEVPRIVAPHVPLIAAPEPQNPRYAAGAERAYAIELRLEAGLAAADGPRTAAPTTVFEVAGSWVETFIGGDHATARYRVCIADAKLFARESVALRAELATPFFVERDHEGGVLALHFEHGVGTVARGILKSAVAARQVVLRSGAAWTSTELDPTGEYEARYTRGADLRLVEKARVRYTRLATARGLRPTAEVGTATVADSTQIHLTAEGELERLTSTLSTELDTGKGMPRARGRLVASFQLRASRVASTHAGDLDAKRSELDEVAMITKPDATVTAEAMREADARVVGSATLEDLTKGLAKAPLDDPKGRAEAMARLRADFRLRKEDAARAVALVQTAPVEDGKAVTAALGGVGTIEAQRALVGIVDDTRTPLPVRLNASSAILLLASPSPEMVGALRRQMQDADPDIRGASSLALGSVVGGLGVAAAAPREEGMSTLLANLQAAQDPDDRALALRALGNSGDPRTAPLARQALSDPSVDVRIAAVDAVRLVRTAQADEVLSAAMLTDADPTVRREAVDTVTRYRLIPAYFQAYAAILAGDPFPLVRRAVVQSLGAVPAAPEAVALLTQAARDSSADVRAVAEAALHSSSSP